MKKGHATQNVFTIGIISDTHGLLRPEAVNALQGTDMIIHAGDIGAPFIIDQLGCISDVIAVRGNMDRERWSDKLKRSDVVDKHGVLIYVIHDLAKMDLDPSAAGIHAVISGHTHRPSISEHESIMYINPGSAGPRRFRLPASIALLHVRGPSLCAELMELNV